MKTNQIMIRPMGSFQVCQRTKDGMFNATMLLKQWEITSGKRKDVSEFLSNKSTKEFISALEDENDNTGIPVFTKSRGKNGGTWMAPLLFIDFAMWINPKFKVKVLKFVYDELIKFRHDAGDNYKGLTSSASSLHGVDYPKLAKALNWIVFGKHSKELRQVANQQQLKELSELQRNLAFMIDMGSIKTFKELIAVLTRMWHKKNNQVAA